MNIIEAIKSGKRIRRTAWIPSTSPEYWTTSLSQAFTFTKEDLLADDWEIEQATVTITREQFDEAWDRATPFDFLIDEKKRNDVAKELGL